MNIKFIKDEKKHLRVRREKVRLNKKIKHVFFIFSILCLIYLLGVWIGAVYLKENLYASDINGSINYFKSEFLINFDIQRKELLANTCIQNITILMIYWIIGLSVIGVPILIFLIFYEGISIGMSIVYILLCLGFYKGYSFIYTSMYVSTIINIFSMIILCYSAIKVSFNIFRKNKDIKVEFFRHTGICLLMFFILVLSSFIEVYMVEIGQKLALNG